MNPRLEAETRAYVALRDWLVEQYQANPDNPFIAGTLEGETSFHELIGELAREARRRKANADALAGIIAENEVRKARHERAAESIRTAIARAMIEADVKKVEAPDATISVRIGAPGVKVVSEELLPEWAWKSEIVRKIDLTLLKREVLELERQTSGVVKTNGAPILTIRGT